MSVVSPEDRLDAAREQAALWCVRLADDDLSRAEHEELQAWFDADETHRGLLDDAVTAWRAIEEQAASPGMIALRGEALEDLRRAQRERWARPAQRPALWTALAASLVVAVAAGVAWRASLPDVYRTTEGERRIVELADGSRASLDSATVLKVKYESGRRRLWLDSGRAKFSVAKDPLRPFSVAAGDKLVVATGTVFSVERLTGQMRVVLYEGHVAVLDDRTGRSETPVPIRIGAVPAEKLLTPDHELVTSTSSDATVVSPTDPARARSWENGQLVFQDEPMDLAVERVNRYARDKLRIGDPGVGRLRISGVFTSGDTGAFVDGVTAVLPVHAVAANGVTVLKIDRGQKNSAPAGVSSTS
ncbi:iron dicitrate transport regulator FecR [Caulobacter sp. Root655]|uniref:FecR family protein n=1 Tax=Caulobacter sp. Root655 TaxID=1736578 RepID=UPI000700EF15|nr:FecR domain-containing protein [Caulobacter sp. Root655]KRA59555.1 iron dicitrate transport regulator FecR [Caulobacter sp. Root655]